MLLIVATGVFWMATMQLTYAGSVAANSIFFAYAYVVVKPEHYAIATAGVYACYHGGNFLASMAGELLVRHTDVGRHIVALFYISWVSTSIACVIFVTLVPQPILRPPVSIFSILRGTPSPEEAQVQTSFGTNGDTDSSNGVHGATDLAIGLPGVLRELRQVYASREVQLASLWMILGNGATNLGMQGERVALSRAQLLSSHTKCH